MHIARSLRYHPEEMRIAPRLDPTRSTAPPRPRDALLINPFYPKDPHASFGKHVLTPSLALTRLDRIEPELNATVPGDCGSASRGVRRERRNPGG